MAKPFLYSKCNCSLIDSQTTRRNHYHRWCCAVRCHPHCVSLYTGFLPRFWWEILIYVFRTRFCKTKRPLNVVAWEHSTCSDGVSSDKLMSILLLVTTSPLFSSFLFLTFIFMFCLSMFVNHILGFSPSQPPLHCLSLQVIIIHRWLLSPKSVL